MGTRDGKDTAHAPQTYTRKQKFKMMISEVHLVYPGGGEICIRQRVVGIKQHVAGSRSDCYGLCSQQCVSRRPSLVIRLVKANEQA